MNWRGSRVIFLFGGLVSWFVLHWACDKGMDPNFFKGRIRGTVHIEKKVPPQTDEIRVYALKTFPTLDILKLLEAADSGKLPVNKTNTQQDVAFEIEVPLEPFDAVIAIWKESGKTLNPFDVVGSYCNENYSHIPIELTELNPVVDSVDLDLDLGIVNRVARVKVDIKFEGDFPSVAFLALTFDDENSGPIQLCTPPQIELFDDDDTQSIQETRRFSGEFPVSPRPTLIRVVRARSLTNFEVIGQTTVNVTAADSISPAIADTIIANFDAPLSTHQIAERLP